MQWCKPEGLTLFWHVAAFMWFEVWAKFPGWKALLLPGPGEDWRTVFERTAPDGQPWINEEALAFFDYNVAVSVVATLTCDDVVECARDFCAKRTTVYEARKTRNKPAGWLAAMPTWGEELQIVLEAYTVSGVPTQAARQLLGPVPEKGRNTT
jgi:hypothetical protein